MSLGLVAALIASLNQPKRGSRPSQEDATEKLATEKLAQRIARPEPLERVREHRRVELLDFKLNVHFGSIRRTGLRTSSPWKSSILLVAGCFGEGVSIWGTPKDSVKSLHES